MGVRDLDVRGNVDTNKLTPDIMYGISFHVKLQNAAKNSWSVNVSLELQGMKKQVRTMDLKEMLKGEPMEIPAGQFIIPPARHDTGDDEARKLTFSLWNHNGNWKTGLIVKGVSIKPL